MREIVLDALKTGLLLLVGAVIMVGGIGGVGLLLNAGSAPSTATLRGPCASMTLECPDQPELQAQGRAVLTCRRLLLRCVPLSPVSLGAALAPRPTKPPAVTPTPAPGVPEAVPVKPAPAPKKRSE